VNCEAIHHTTAFYNSPYLYIVLSYQ